ncbi:MAG TPA: hypothetical protein VFE46_09625 [Pirellulales bacterium]|nr:hypothetical protein [Pirellulales bacterium]
MIHRSFPFACALLVTASACCGCNRGPATGDVNGQVTLDGKPVVIGSVIVTAIDGKTPSAGAGIQNGQYELKHVVVNKYQVAISAPKVFEPGHIPPGVDTSGGIVPPETVPAKYNLESVLTLDVQEGSNQHDFKLESK